MIPGAAEEAVASNAVPVTMWHVDVTLHINGNHLHWTTVVHPVGPLTIQISTCSYKSEWTFKLHSVSNRPCVERLDNRPMSGQGQRDVV